MADQLDMNVARIAEEATKDNLAETFEKLRAYPPQLQVPGIRLMASRLGGGCVYCSDAFADWSKRYRDYVSERTREGGHHHD